MLPTAVLGGLLVLSMVWLGAAVVTASGGHVPSLPFTAPAKSTSSGPAHVYLTIAFNPVNGYDEYFPANFTVPANTPVVFTIQSWDAGINNVSAMYLNVIGTQNGMMEYNDGLGDATQMMSHVGADRISHTFTVMSPGASGGGMMGGGMMGGGMPMMNVPIPAVTNVSDPISVTFTATFTSTGVLTWMCFAPCDPMSMGTPGYMSGTMTVV